jgi:hypothetical protein
MDLNNINNLFMPFPLFVQVLSSIMIYFFYRIGRYILLKISNEHHRSFHFCCAALSTQSFFPFTFWLRVDPPRARGKNVVVHHNFFIFLTHLRQARLFLICFIR